MNGKSINFDDKNINKSNFYRNKKLFSIDDIDVNNTLISKKDPYGTKNALKYFLGYNDNDEIRPLCIKFKHFDSNKTMSFEVIDKNSLKSTPKYGKELAVY